MKAAEKASWDIEQEWWKCAVIFVENDGEKQGDLMQKGIAKDIKML